MRAVSINEFHGRNEPVAATGDCFNVAGSVSAIGKGVPEFAYRSVQAGLKIDKGIFGPEVFFQFFAGDHLTLSFGEEHQNAQGLFLQPDPGAVLAYLPCCQVYKIRPELEHWRAGGLLHGGSFERKLGLARF